MTKITPILKWAGGKRQLLSKIIPLIPNDYECYFEPFVGAGAVLFDLQPSKAIVNDANSELINVYYVIKEQPLDLIELLLEYESKHCKDFYYSIREQDRTQYFAKLSKLEKAARTIYLNRTCYNGLYRVNRKGHFNTPMGRNSSIQIVNEDGINRISQYLNSNDVMILNGNYVETINTIHSQDFVFFDPPYYPMNRDSFVRYDMSPFGIKEQLELKQICDDLNSRGIRFLQTNSLCSEIIELYSDYCMIEVDVRRCINNKVDGRKGKEVIIYNY